MDFNHFPCFPVPDPNPCRCIPDPTPMYSFHPNILTGTFLPCPTYPIPLPFPLYEFIPDSIFLSPLPSAETMKMYRLQSETIAALNYSFSFANLLQDSFLQSRMNRSLWVPLEEFLNFNQLALLGISFEQLQEYAIQNLCRFDTSFELDSTITLIRPNWGKTSHMNLKVTRHYKVSTKKNFSIAKKILKEALTAVADSQQVAFENEDIEIVVFGREQDGSFSASFNAPGIPSLIEPVVSGYRENGVEVTVIEMMDSMFLPSENRSHNTTNEKSGSEDTELSPKSIMHDLEPGKKKKAPVSPMKKSVIQSLVSQ